MLGERNLEFQSLETGNRKREHFVSIEKLDTCSRLGRESLVSWELRLLVKALFVCLLLSAVTFAAPAAKVKSAAAYYGDAAYLYFQNRLPSAEIACDEGLEKYPNDSRLQNLKARIQEAKDEQEKQNEQNNPNGQNQNNQNQNDNQDQDKDRQNQDQDKDNGDNQNQEQNQNGENQESSSSGANDQNEQNSNGAGESSSSVESSSSAGEGQNDQEQNQQNEQDSENGEQPEDPGAMSKAEASQLLKDFDEHNGERKPWKPMRGQAYPEKDW